LVPPQSHPQIEINSDADFALQGWPGSGTQIDPFRIENLTFNPLQFHDDCIKIQNTTVHFIIQNCTFWTSSEWYYAGIFLDNTTNAIMRNNTLSSGYGIKLLNANWNEILNNTLDGNRVSVVLSNSSHNTIRFNNGSGTHGIEISNRSISNLIHMNSLEYEGAGISIEEFEGTVVANNSLINAGFSIFSIQRPFPGLNQSQFQGNTLNGKPIIFLLDQDSSALPLDVGQLFLINCSNTEMSDNILTAGPQTISFCLSENITIQNNEFLETEGQVPGLIILNCEIIQIRNNTFYKTNGFYVKECNTCHIYNNSFLGEDTYGVISIRDSQFCTISENNHIIIYVERIDTISITQNLCESKLNPDYYFTKGIWVKESTVVRIQNNTCTNCRFGIYCEYTMNIIINNTCFDNWFGIYVREDNGGLVENNYCKENGIGIVLYECWNNILQNNTCVDNGSGGISVRRVQNFQVRNNYCSNNEYGISLRQISAGELNIVEHNNCSNNHGGTLYPSDGIRLVEVRDIIISNNTCNFNDNAGIQIEDGVSIIISENQCSENSLGLSIVGDSRSIAITGNICSENSYGLSFTGEGRTINVTENVCSENQIGLFVHNRTRHCHVINNHFLWNRNESVVDEGFYGVFDGNFWSDYVGWDLNFDGYGDIPYIIPGRAESLDFRPRGFILTRSLQIWMLILFVVGVLVVVAVIGWHFLVTPQRRKRFFWISR
ncbi:MAG: right-handed parallel beta-helix repeat-containing protein, partial [Candidatus Hermodarchaeota archaeon]|nr:right-handed parallel beta-helix repeat-containing protein [Candidatus Hermodarchaeota archaeon]